MSEIVKRLEARAKGDGSGNHATKPYTVFDSNLDRAAAAEIQRLSTALDEAKSDELRKLNGDYDHIKEEYYSKGFVEAREAAARICDRNDKSAWGFAAEIRSLTPPTEKAT